MCLARLAIALLPFRLWRDRLGFGAGAAPGEETVAQARRLARRVDRAAARLPLHFKCLPRAMALSWMLRRKAIGHTLVFAIRPQPLRADEDRLHAWVEVGEVIVIGDLPGPWHPLHRSAGRAA